MWIVGNRQHAMLLLGHDATHKLVSRNRYINYWLGNVLCYAPIGLSWHGYKDFHMRHHKWLGTDKDPELNRKRAAGLVQEKATKGYIIKRYILDLFGLGIKDFKHMVIKRNWGDWAIIIPCWLFILSLGFISIWIPIIWFGAMTTGLLATSRLRIWHEHVGANHTHKIKPTLWSQLLFLPHGAAYHHEHHEHPSVPYHKLPKIAEKNRKKVSEIH